MIVIPHAKTLPNEARIYTECLFVDSLLELIPRDAHLLQRQQQILTLQLHAGADVERLDDAGTGRLDHHFHLHRGQNHQRLTLFDAIADLDLDFCWLMNFG